MCSRLSFPSISMQSFLVVVESKRYNKINSEIDKVFSFQNMIYMMVAIALKHDFTCSANGKIFPRNILCDWCTFWYAREFYHPIWWVLYISCIVNKFFHHLFICVTAFSSLHGKRSDVDGLKHFPFWMQLLTLTTHFLNLWPFEIGETSSTQRLHNILNNAIWIFLAQDI